MKKSNKISIIIIGLILSAILALIPGKALAIDLSDTQLAVTSLEKQDISDRYKYYVSLTDEEKENLIIPSAYNLAYTETTVYNPFALLKETQTEDTSYFHLKDIIKENMKIRNQGSVGACLAFATLASFETNLALQDYYEENDPEEYDYSELHIMYAASNSFNDDKTTASSFLRDASDGLSYPMIERYLSVGMGPVLEEDMPYDETLTSADLTNINISEMEAITSQGEVSGVLYFPTINYSQIDDAKQEVINDVKNFVQNTGAVIVSCHSDSYNTCFNTSHYSIYCNIEKDNQAMVTEHMIDHAVAIVGWDDTYPKENFVSQPENDRAWICKNSWGEANASYPNYDGYLYISYEDGNILSSAYGIMGASTDKSYDNVYSYDENGSFPAVNGTGSGMILLTKFDLNSTEYITKVGITVLEDVKLSLYMGKTNNLDELDIVTLKDNATSTVLHCGYNSIELATPIEQSGTVYVCFILELLDSSASSMTIACSYPWSTEQDNTYNFGTVETNTNFILMSDDNNNLYWQDLGQISSSVANIDDFDLSTKLYTTNEMPTTKPKKITAQISSNKFIEGEKVDKDDITVTVEYDDGTTRQLTSDEFQISDGDSIEADQTTLQIVATVDGKTLKTKIEIEVEANTLIKLIVTKLPNKTTYNIGENFQTDGMIITAKYKNGTEEQITDYELENWTNLQLDQISVTIKYGGLEVDIPITVEDPTAPKLTSIYIKTMPDKTTYKVGEVFDPTGMVVMGVYSDESEEVITSYSYSKEKLVLGTTSIEITYNNKTASVAIIVENISIVGIEADTTNVRTTYIEGDDFDATNLIVYVVYDNGEKELITDYVIKNGEDLTTDQTSIKIIYGEFTTTIQIVVNEQPKVDTVENSDFTNQKGKITKTTAYMDVAEPYLDMDFEVCDIVRNLNYSFDYYFYFSPSNNESNITEWTKISQSQTDATKISFSATSNEIPNFDELQDASMLYLYIKEVAKNGTATSTYVTTAMELTETEQFIIKNYDSGKTEEEDPNVSDKNLPYTGTSSTLVIICTVIFAYTIITFIKYARVNNSIKKKERNDINKVPNKKNK